MMLQKTKRVDSKDINLLEEVLKEIINDGGTIDFIITNTHARGAGWLIIYTPIQR